VMRIAVRAGLSGTLRQADLRRSAADTVGHHHSREPGYGVSGEGDCEPGGSEQWIGGSAESAGPAGPAAARPCLPLGGALERVVASGQVAIARPGLAATGERLVYTAGDQVFLLTGTKDAPPKAVDARHDHGRGVAGAQYLRCQRRCSVEAWGKFREPAQRCTRNPGYSTRRTKRAGRNELARH